VALHPQKLGQPPALDDSDEIEPRGESLPVQLRFNDQILQDTLGCDASRIGFDRRLAVRRLAGILRRLLSLLSGMKISVPLSMMVSDCFADMTDLVLGFMGAERSSRLRPCPSARPGVASASASRTEGDHPPAGPLKERICTSEWLTAKIQDVRERGRLGRPLGSAAALAGASPWRARGGAHSSSREKRSVSAERQRRPLAGRATGLKGQPQERQHSAARRNAGPTALGERLKSDFTTRWYQFCICDIVSMLRMSMHGLRMFTEPIFTEDDMAKKAKKAKKTAKAATKKVAKKTSKKKK
jgi:hypothetical protein